MNYTQRIQLPRFLSDEDYEVLEQFLIEHRACIDEISLFTDHWHHAYMPLEEYQKLCDMLGRRIKRLKEIGFKKVGLNPLATIGHIDEALDWMPPLPWQKMMGPDGAVSQSCFCPTNESFREYNRQKYQMAAATNPDFIWVDDDIRMHFHTVPFACFCPHCIEIFNESNHTHFSRETLVEALNRKDSAKLREKWVEQNMKSIENLMSDIEIAVHEINPKIEMGLMTTAIGWTSYSTWSYEPWMKALDATKGRPGGGFWSEEKPHQMISKVLEASRQISLYPDQVRDRLYEFEGGHCILVKSNRLLATESTAALMVGCNGWTYNGLKEERGTLEDYHTMFATMEQFGALWKKIDAGSPKLPDGFCAALSPKYTAYRKVETENWFELSESQADGYSSNRAYALADIGVCLTANHKAKCRGFLLEGELIRGYTREELLDILSGPVFMDGEALEFLWEIGLGEYCGIHISKKYSNGIFEIYTDDELNGAHKGEHRDVRMSFHPGYAYELKSDNPSARVLSTLQSYSGEKLGNGMMVCENQLGGKIAVAGYFPWDIVAFGLKRTQLLNVLDWLTEDQMPLRIMDYKRVFPLVKTTEDDSEMLVMLTNASIDPTGTFQVRFRGTPAHIWEIDQSGQKRPCILQPDHRTLSVSNIDSWDFRMFQLEYTKGEK